jgi:hypothetical protein
VKAVGNIIRHGNEEEMSTHRSSTPSKTMHKVRNELLHSPLPSEVEVEFYEGINSVGTETRQTSKIANLTSKQYLIKQIVTINNK